MHRVWQIVSDLLNSTRNKVAQIDGLDLLRGEGTVVDRHTVRVQGPDGDRQVRGRCLVIATGSRPVRPGFLPWMLVCSAMVFSRKCR